MKQKAAGPPPSAVSDSKRRKSGPQNPSNGGSSSGLSETQAILLDHDPVPDKTNTSVPKVGTYHRHTTGSMSMTS